MGLENNDFPFTFKTVTIANASNAQQFSSLLLAALDSSCDLFISPIFKKQSLVKEIIQLDECFIPCDESFSRRQMPHICPLLDSNCFNGKEDCHKRLKFLAQYFIYLGLKRIAVRFDQTIWEQMCSQMLKIAKILKGSRIGVVLIASQPAGSIEENNNLWRTFIKCRQQLAGKVDLEFCLQIGPGNQEQWALERWLGENIVYLSFTRELFSMNQKGFPVLPVQSQKFLKRCFMANIYVALTISTPLTSKLLLGYFKYFAFILQKQTQSLNEYDLKIHTLVDHLQIPLQPYRDNLEAQTYDIFEKDQFKYNEYQIALIQALDSFMENRTLVCYYVGSGKGLILEKLIKAAKRLKKMVKVYCIEKNPYPLQTLKRRITRNKWSKFVQIVQADIKQYKMPEKPDIIFSELLGGLGDNELSPQCLKWAEKNCDKDTKWVPERYTAFIRPVSTFCLHQQLSAQQRQEYFTVYFSKYHCPFKSQKIWEFVHPLGEDNLKRKTVVSWKASQDSLLHGFEGSFDCNLYGKAYFSIVPENKDKHFYSWFPIFFSFKDEQMIEAGQEISIEILRNSNNKKIWYSWKYWIRDREGNLKKQSQFHNQQGSLAIQLQDAQ